MKKQIFVLLILFTFAFSISAQEKEASKVGEIDSFWECEIARATVDNFFIQLQRNPQAAGFIIVYEGKYSERIKGKTKTFPPRRGEAADRIQIIRNHIKLRNYNSEKVLFVDGGFRAEHKIEFWLVPKAAELPKPTPTLDKMQYRKGEPSWQCEEGF